MFILTQLQIEKYLRDGVLVVDDIMCAEELKVARDGLHETLLHHGVDTNDLENTAHHLQKLSSTNGSGGVLDLFYPSFKIDIGSNEKLFRATQQLWKASHAHNGESEHELILMGKQERYHPFGKFDADKGYMYIDRLGYRIPTKIAQSVGEKMNPSPEGEQSKTKKSRAAIQRSLTPHLDCCPDTYNSASKKSKWRPIQCFVSLTDNVEPNTGGFEAATGFHREFHQWATNRPPSTITHRDPKSGAKSKIEVTAPCVGEYTHIRPKEDEHVMKSIFHVPVLSGSAVFWDNRIPHANAYRNESVLPRAVVYCSFLPDVDINRIYVEKQLEDYRLHRKPRDTWINIVDHGSEVESSQHQMRETHEFSELGRKLMGMQEW
jgi:hypothetical protein